MTTPFSERSKRPVPYEEVAFNPPNNKLPLFPSTVAKNIVMDETSPRQGGVNSPKRDNTTDQDEFSARGGASAGQQQQLGGAPNLNRKRRANSQLTAQSQQDNASLYGTSHSPPAPQSTSSTPRHINIDDETQDTHSFYDFSMNDGGMTELQTLKDSIHENIHQLTTNCRRFKQQFDNEIDLSRKNLEQHLVESFIDISKNKLPDVYLRSIPKFGGNEVSDALFRTLVAMKKDKQNVIKVKFDQDIIDDISKIVQDNIGDVFYDPITIFSTLVGSIRNHMDQINHHTDQMELLLVNFKGKNQELEQELKHLKRLLTDKSEEEEQLKEELQEKDLQMDIIRQQIVRRNTQLDEQRSAFHKELTQVKMKLYEKDEMGKPITNDDIPVGDFTLKFLQGNNFELEENEDDALEEKLQENVRKLEESFRREKRSMKKKHQSEIQEKELEIQGLSNKVIRLQSQLKKLSLLQAKNAQGGGGGDF